MVNESDISLSSQDQPSSLSERKHQLSRDIYVLGAETSASSKIDSHLTAAETSEVDNISFGTKTNKKKKERKQSFGTKKKFKEEMSF
jgi:hypothetical protein